VTASSAAGDTASTGGFDSRSIWSVKALWIGNDGVKVANADIVSHVSASTLVFQADCAISMPQRAATTWRSQVHSRPRRMDGASRLWGGPGFLHEPHAGGIPPV